jgi:hypothetical protein
MSARDPVKPGRRLGPLTLGEVKAGRDSRCRHALHRDFGAVEVLEAAHDEGGVETNTLRDRARKLKELRHPGLQPILDLVTSDDRDFWVLEPTDGLSLDLLRQEGAFARPEDVLELARQMFTALDALHAAGLAHGGVSASTIEVVFDENWRAVLTGFEPRQTSQGADIEAAAATLRDLVSTEDVANHAYPGDFLATIGFSVGQYPQLSGDADHETDAGSEVPPTGPGNGDVSGQRDEQKVAVDPVRNLDENIEDGEATDTKHPRLWRWAAAATIGLILVGGALAFSLIGNGPGLTAGGGPPRESPPDVYADDVRPAPAPADGDANLALDPVSDDRPQGTDGDADGRPVVTAEDSTPGPQVLDVPPEPKSLRREPLPPPQPVRRQCQTVCEQPPSRQTQSVREVDVGGPEQVPYTFAISRAGEHKAIAESAARAYCSRNGLLLGPHTPTVARCVVGTCTASATVQCRRQVTTTSYVAQAPVCRVECI